ncbi:hypothetical protein AXJ76_24760 (plasmid) [Enterobacter cloacae]|nr:hypothetical protein AXJ76_24760 [Enterobacter cloacae]
MFKYRMQLAYGQNSLTGKLYCIFTLLRAIFIVCGQTLLLVHICLSSIRRHCQPLADLTPLIAKLAFSPDSVLPSWAGLLTLAPLIRNAPADKD